VAITYNPISREEYIKQRSELARKSYEPAYKSKQTALRQQLEKSLQSAQQQRRTLESDYQAALNRLAEQKAEQLPQYKQMKNEADVRAVQDVQALREAMARRGLFHGGRAISREAAIRNQAAAAIHAANEARNRFLAQMANRAAELEQQKAAQFANIAEQIDLMRRHGTEQERMLAEELADRLAAAQLQAGISYEDYARQAALDELNRRLQEAQLTGMYGGTPTLAARQLEQQQAIDEYNRRLALMQALMGYNLGIGELTGNLPIPTNFNVNDRLVELLNALRIGGA